MFKKKEALWYAAIIAALLAVVLGYGIWSKDQGSAIQVIAPLPGTKVFINGELEGETGTLKREVNARLPGGQYTVIVSKDEHWPWMKNVSLGVNAKISLRPFTLPQSFEKRIIPEETLTGKKMAANPEYQKAWERFGDAPVSAPVRELLPSTGVQQVKNADFYPGRDDVLIISAKNQVFAIESNPGEPRNFQPIYSGINPNSVRGDGNDLFVRDGEVLYVFELPSM